MKEEFFGMKGELSLLSDFRIFEQMVVTIDTDNPKAQAFVEFIKTLEFVHIEDYALSDEQLSAVNETRAAYLDGEKTFSQEEVKEHARKK